MFGGDQVHFICLSVKFEPYILFLLWPEGRKPETNKREFGVKVDLVLPKAG